MSLVVASMMKDEAGRFLRPVLDVWGSFAGGIVVLDDGSTDATADICGRAGAYVVCRSRFEASAWGTEAPARRQLFEIAWDVAKIDDYILFLDADMIPARDPRRLMETEPASVAFVLYDLWSLEPPMYRTDSFWQAHTTHRTWMVRKTKDHEPWEWSERGVHCGHLPVNWTGRTLHAPPDFGLLHLAYVTPELRQEKYISYASVATQLSDFERQHAISILDDDPWLAPLDCTPEWEIGFGDDGTPRLKGTSEGLQSQSGEV